MAKTPEGLVKDAVVKVLKAHGVYYFFPATHGYGRSGVPDIVCCVKGRFLAIECKAPGKKPTALQAKEMNEIGKAGGMALVIDSADVEAFESFLGSLS
jgi:Holliday junction resolvase